MCFEVMRAVVATVSNLLRKKMYVFLAFNACRYDVVAENFLLRILTSVQ